MMTAKKVLVVGIALLMMLGAMSFVAGDQGMETPDADEPPRLNAGSTPRTVLVEDFTATWCPPCTVVAPALSRIADEYSHEQLAILSWHGGSSDLQTPNYSPRANYYGWGYLPTVVIDGGGPYPDSTLWKVGSGGGTTGSYTEYVNMIDLELTYSTNLKIDLWGSIDATNANVLARIEATDPITQPDLYVYFALFEDDLYAVYQDQTTKNGYHRHVVRDWSVRSLDVIEGDVVYMDETFPLLPGYDPQRLGVVVFVQTDAISGQHDYPPPPNPPGTTHINREVLQSAELDFIPEQILLVNDIGSPFNWYWNDQKYQKLLSYNDYSFDTWDTLSGIDSGTSNFRDMPVFEDLEKYDVIFWFTNTTSSTIGSAERTNLSLYLDASSNLLITGQNIGDDVNANDPAFLSNYLHASFITGSSGDSSIQGNASDPISSPWSATTLTIDASSPDVIDPADIWTNTTFEYAPSGQSAGLRAQHDTDSKVVFLGFNYFDLEQYRGPAGTSWIGANDPDRPNVLKNILDWLMPSQAPSNPPSASTIIDAAKSPDNMNVTITWNASADDGAGEDDVISYNIYWSMSYSGPYAYLASVPATKALTYSWDHIGANLEPQTFFYRIYAEDATQETASTETVVKFYHPMAAGMNLVSIPIDPIDTTIPSVLQGISFDKVWIFDSSDANDPWKSFMEAKPYKGDLAALNSTMGFWIEATADTALTIVGLVPTCTNIALYSGWNLVSYPGFVPQSVPTALSSVSYSRVEGFDPGAPPHYVKLLLDMDTMLPGYGYWIKVDSPTVWTVCN